MRVIAPRLLQAAARRHLAATTGMAAASVNSGRFSKVLAMDQRDPPRMRVLDYRLPAGARATLQHAWPTLRWEVASKPEADTPAPLFFEAGVTYSVDNEGGEERREIVFELLHPEPRFGEDALKAMESNATFDPMIGTRVNFENHLCRAVEIRLPPGGGDPDPIHQHLLDYAHVFLGDTQVKFYHPGTGGKAAFMDDVMLPDGENAIFKPIGIGDLTPGYTVHSLTNANALEWLRCYQVELK